MLHSSVVAEQLTLKLVAASRNKMDCVTTSRVSAPCALRGASCSPGKTHIVGVDFFCARHCPVHEEGRRLAIAAEPEPGVCEELTLA